MDALKKDEIYTMDDIYALPDGERAELIDGKITWFYKIPNIREFPVICIMKYIIILKATMENVRFLRLHLLCS